MGDAVMRTMTDRNVGRAGSPSPLALAAAASAAAPPRSRRGGRHGAAPRRGVATAPAASVGGRRSRGLDVRRGRAGRAHRPRAPAARWSGPATATPTAQLVVELPNTRPAAGRRRPDVPRAASSPRSRVAARGADGAAADPARRSPRRERRRALARRRERQRRCGIDARPGRAGGRVGGRVHGSGRAGSAGRASAPSRRPRSPPAPSRSRRGGRPPALPRPRHAGHPLARPRAARARRRPGSRPSTRLGDGATGPDRGRRRVRLLDLPLSRTRSASSSTSKGSSTQLRAARSRSTPAWLARVRVAQFKPHPAAGVARGLRPDVGAGAAGDRAHGRTASWCASAPRADGGAPASAAPRAGAGAEPRRAGPSRRCAGRAAARRRRRP